MVEEETNKYENMATQQEDEEKALVIWSIINCPIPDGHDPCLVVPRIQTALEKSRRGRPYGSLSITAISNNLTEIPGEDVMRKLSSAGISLKHAHGVSTDMYQWARRNPPPATIMVISGHVELECLASTFSGLKNKGYRILLTYPQRDPVLASLPKHCFWETLLSDTDNNLETTTRLVFPYRLDHGTGELPWSCSVCHYDAPTFEDFTKHLKCETHAYFEWDMYASKNNVDRTNPANLQLGRSPEWDLLAKESMLYRSAIRKQRGAFAPPKRSKMWVDATTFK
ncbi:hypothetical protein BRARA_A03379 [Brassica rapa]|uniref:NYN domain-containing protein n=1 Tax=Brassica campestris TaxID=3711 RepID=A0A398AYH7_BRACM|nr:hypothetical protein BRARA_A03379 [Brassica rapa]